MTKALTECQAWAGELWFFGNAHDHFEGLMSPRDWRSSALRSSMIGRSPGGLAMGAHRSRTLFARSSLGPARTLHCDHCREELGLSVHRYWHMHFCSSACVTEYQRRLAPETKVKISQLEASRESLAAAW